MPVFKRTYNAGGFRINVLTNEGYFIKLLDNCLRMALTKTKTNGVFSVTLKILDKPLTIAPGKNNKNILHFGNSIIDIPHRIIYSYYPSLPSAEEAVILLNPLWCLLLYLDYYPLHGALIKSGNDFLAFFGPSGSGKSTLSSASCLYGFSLICDDCFFVKNTEKTIKILPFTKAVKVRNIHNKSPLNLDSLKISLKQAFFLAKSLVIIFPKYSLQKKMRLCPISNKQGVLNLMGDNFFLKTGQPDNKKIPIKMLDFIFQLGKKSSFYELVYNDSNIFSGGLQALDGIKKQS